MKKILGISLVAVLTAMPLIAGAATGDAVNAAPTTDANGPTTVAPKYATVADSAADATSLATATYVKGAYNAAIKAINTVDTNYKAADTAINTKIGDTTLTTASQTLTGAIEEIKTANATTAGDGLTKTDGEFDVNVDSATIGLNSSNALEVVAGGIDTTQLADGAVTTAKLDADAVTNAKLADNAVQTENIVDGNVTAAKLASDSVTTVKIVDGNVTAAKLASDSVTTAKIVDGNVTKAKLAQGVQDSLALADSALQQSALADYATKAQVTANIDAATASVTGVTLGVTGGVTGTVPAMVNWGDQTAGSVDLANGAIASGATATGNITGIDVAAPSSYQPGAGES
ncbi:MAG: hypothetical protein IK122_00460 [Alphaproteobacteria bacterium]|nr:hypothetical protein [Alphaproteobacteria bacterium]